jgi:hypothetical protein
MERIWKLSWPISGHSAGIYKEGVRKIPRTSEYWVSSAKIYTVHGSNTSEETSKCVKDPCLLNVIHT